MLQVGPVPDSVAQFGPFADIVALGRLMSPIVSITPSEPVSINPDVTEKGLGAFVALGSFAAAINFAAVFFMRLELTPHQAFSCPSRSMIRAIPQTRQKHSAARRTAMQLVGL